MTVTQCTDVPEARRVHDQRNSSCPTLRLYLKRTCVASVNPVRQVVQEEYSESTTNDRNPFFDGDAAPSIEDE